MKLFKFDSMVAEGIDMDDNKNIGINAAIIFERIAFWVKKNEADGRNKRDGKFWTYNSVREFEKVFDFLTCMQIRKALDKLIQNGYIVKNHYGKSRVSWYTLGETGIKAINRPFDGYFYFNGDVAKIAGVNAAVIFQNIGYWIADNENNGKNEIDGKFWTHNTLNEYSDVFHCLTYNQVITALNKLKTCKLITCRHYGDTRMLWYTIAEKGVQFKPEVQSEAAETSLENCTEKPVTDKNLSSNHAERNVQIKPEMQSEAAETSLENCTEKPVTDKKSSSNYAERNVQIKPEIQPEAAETSLENCTEKPVTDKNLSSNYAEHNVQIKPKEQSDSDISLLCKKIQSLRKKIQQTKLLSPECQVTNDEQKLQHLQHQYNQLVQGCNSGGSIGNSLKYHSNLLHNSL